MSNRPTASALATDNRAMFYTLLALIVVILAVILAASAAKLLLQRRWFFGWLRGMVGLALSAMTVVLLLMALDLFTYRQWLVDKTIATVSFIQRGAQVYDAVLVDHTGRRQQFELHGDQWQLDARVFRWPKMWRRWGIKPGYRLDRISGRYLTLVDENTKKRTAYALSDSLTRIDVWIWLRHVSQWLPIVDAHYGSATFVPMVDDGQYEIALSASGLLSRPLNEPAKLAVDRWR